MCSSAENCGRLQDDCAVAIDKNWDNCRRFCSYSIGVADAAQIGLVFVDIGGSKIVHDRIPLRMVRSAIGGTQRTYGPCGAGLIGAG